MNRLIEIMASDMGIRPYMNEEDASFEFRVIYSALGQWCLKSALTEKEHEKGISKSAQSILLHNLLDKYVALCPEARPYMFVSKYIDIAVFIRNLYEQTGYLLTKENNRNILEISLNEFLVRDSLTPDEYLNVVFDECDFDTKDINLDDLEFFNPYYYGNVSSSWHRRMKSDITMARNIALGLYYRVIRKEDGTYLFADDKNTDDLDALTGAEFRRKYIALKKHYDNPMQLLICPIDEEYSYIRVLGQLPNREYYYLLMNAWPKNKFTDRNNFIIRNKLTEQVAKVLGAIGFTARNGEFYG